MSDENVKYELLDVAAVAISMIEQIEFGEANWLARPFDVEPDDGHNNERHNQFEWVAEQLKNQRRMQDNKWGPQRHPLAEWLSILVEEVGEVAQAINDDILFPGARDRRRR